MSLPTTQQYYDQIEATLYTAVVHDVLDEIGYHNQALNPQMRPLTQTTRLVGRAATLLAAQLVDSDEGQPFDSLLQFADSLEPGEVVVGTTGTDLPAALWGEIMSTAARSRGARGVMFDGYGRDASMIIDMAFPAFFTGLTPAGAAGRVKVRQSREPIFIGGVIVSNGDLVIGDLDGCLVIPQAVEAAVISRATEKVSAEGVTRDELLAGGSLFVIYEKYGVL